jgi:hypothetical protein
MMPQMICQAMSAAQNAMSGGGGGGGGGGGSGFEDAKPPKLPMIKSVNEKTKNDCKKMEDDMRCAVSVARGSTTGCASAGENGEMISVAPEIADLSESKDKLQLPKDVEEYVTCGVASPSNPISDLSGGGYVFRNKSRNFVTCTFDRDKCEDKELEKNSDKYLRDKLGLPKMITNLAQSLGGSETRKPSSGTSSPKDFCACTTSRRPVDDRVIQISDAVRKIASFGMAEPSEALRKQRDYQACGKWYFPAKKGQYASTPTDEQPFVGAWKWSMVNQCDGGGS